MNEGAGTASALFQCFSSEYTAPAATRCWSLTQPGSFTESSVCVKVRWRELDGALQVSDGLQRTSSHSALAPTMHTPLLDPRDICSSWLCSHERFGASRRLRVLAYAHPSSRARQGGELLVGGQGLLVAPFGSQR